MVSENNEFAAYIFLGEIKVPSEDCRDATVIIYSDCMAAASLVKVLTIQWHYTGCG